MAKAATNTVKKEKKEKVIVYSPVGRLSFPYLHAADTGRQYSDNKFKAELMIPKAIWVEQGKDLVAAVLACGREYFGKPKLQLKDFKNPFTDMDTEDSCPEVFKGHIRIRAKSQFKPVVIGPKKGADNKFPQFTEEQIKEIKGGDYARLVLAVYSYSQQGGGVTFGLNAVQFAYPGEPIGQGVMKQVEGLSEVEVPLDDPKDMIDTEEGSATDDPDPMSFA